MKKIIIFMLAACLLTGMCACGKQSAEETAPAATARELLETVWASYPEDARFSVIGGDPAGDHLVDGAPGTYSLTDAQALESVFGVPAAMSADIDDAASLQHMMNANTFTCGAFRLKDADKADAFTQALRDSLTNRQWLCGFPDTLLIVGVGSYVISVFGNEELVAQFRDQTRSCYASAQILAEDALSF